MPQSELEEAFPVLLAAAKDPDSLIRASAATALRGRRDHFAEVLPILRGLMKDSSPDVRVAAMIGLEIFVKPGEPEWPALVADFIAALDDPNPAVRMEACRSLRVRVFAKRIPADRPCAVAPDSRGGGHLPSWCLGVSLADEVDPQGPRALLSRALLDSELPVEHILVRQVLIQLGIPDPERDAMLKSMLKSPDYAERFAAAELLIQLGKSDMAIPVLNDMAASGKKSTRGAAEKMLYELKKGGGFSVTPHVRWSGGHPKTKSDCPR